MASSFSRVLSGRKLQIASLLGGSLTAGILLQRHRVGADGPTRRRYPAR